MKKLIILAALFSTSAFSQVITSGAQQVQGTGAVNRGNAVNVRLTDGAGVAVTSTIPTGTAGSPATDVVSVQGVSGGTAQPISAASLPLPTGAATSAAQTTANTSLTTINTTLGSPLQAGGTVVATGNVASAAADSGNPVKIGGVAGSTLASTTAGNRINARYSIYGEQFVRLSQSATLVADGMASYAGLVSDVSNTEIVQAPLASMPYAYNGSTWDRVRGNTNGIVALPGLSSTFWSYSSGASPILSNTTTAVTIKTAAGASVRNYITSCQITTTAFGASVPLAIRDGAAGTVIWALTVPTAGFLQPANITFPVPLRSTANTLLEIVTTTANTTGTVTANCQGFTGA